MSQTKVEAPFVEGGGGTPFKNKFINGDFQVHQRFDGSAVTASTGYQSFDRWKTVRSNTSANWTIEKETLSAADVATTGHKQAMEIKCTGTDTSTGAAEYNVMFHAIEANTLQDLNYGTSAAKSFTVSFWVRAYQTGTFVLGLAKSDGTTYYNRIEYTINASNTWEHKTLVFSPTAGDTSLITGANGYIDNDTGQGMGFYFVLNAGSNYQGTNNVWTTGSISTSNQTNLFSSTDNHWSITGVQMEVGDQKTDFEYLPFDVQLHRCKRYFENYVIASGGGIPGLAFNNTNATTALVYKVTKRAAPTVGGLTAARSGTGLSFLTAAGSYPNSDGALASHSISVDQCRINGTSFSDLTNPGPSLFYATGENTITLDAEF